MITYSSVSNEKAKSFLHRSSAQNEQISISDAAFWCGAFDDVHGLIGVVGVSYTKNTARIKAFYVDEAFRGKKVGRYLLYYAMYDDEVTQYIFKAKRKITVFSSESSRKLFRELGFKTVREQANNIHFMELIQND